MSNWLRIAEVASIAVVLIILITQVLMPAVRGQLLFPIFRTRGKLETKLAEAKQEEGDEKVLNKIVETMAGVEPQVKPKRKRKQAP